MKLRNLKISDAMLMLEWMHDPAVVEFMQTDFLSKTLEDCERFIIAAQDTSRNLHLALADDNDAYMGTVSLKHITEEAAEFAITVRKCAMGKGYANYEMEEIFTLGVMKYKKCVSSTRIHMHVRCKDGVA